ncbi:TrlF family AAA-like ATPase [Herbaspirillum camelliae]|uniref:TrlF family AAA-like ATPase n=1 Tax=Herbaspirillum camelliae TaxID=1892903 RepID=UPI000B31C8B1|nr:hypothetical protein [Herbaspirillum camelliae]
MTSTRWLRCDLQVATPAWDFKFPQGSNYNIGTPEGRITFLDDYMSKLKAKGIDVIALADHNTGDWIDEAKAAGKRHGIVVFPGCEITTNTGADGVHLVIIGDLNKSTRDYQELLFGSLGFNHEHPPFLEQGGRRFPGTSQKTLLQILDDLPDGFLAIAPHALSQNGIASANTAKGEIRWRALHHERLVAIDPGDCKGEFIAGDAFNAKFRRRELGDFPCLQNIPFIATSDAYSMDDLGKRFTWMRMGEVNIEGLRQAFLDRESRVFPYWDDALDAFPERNPNLVRHAWISSVKLGGTLSNTIRPLEIPLHPNLNVIIGGRGSGKSTIVSALRQLYSNTNTLPKRLKDDADSFIDAVFKRAELSSTFLVQESQEKKTAVWKSDTGTLAISGDQRLPLTDFPVTVISQKELFERAAGDKNDPYLSSRSLLALIDTSLGFFADSKEVSSYGRALEDARLHWSNKVRNHVLLVQDLAHLPGLRQRQNTLQGQVAAFSSPEVLARLQRIETRQREMDYVTRLQTKVDNALTQMKQISTHLREPNNGDVQVPEPFSADFWKAVGEVQHIISNLADKLDSATGETYKLITDYSDNAAGNTWRADAAEALADFTAYKEGLAAQGLSTAEFSRLQEELGKTTETIRALESRILAERELLEDANDAWHAFHELLIVRRTSRQALLDDVQRRSGRLRFKVKPLNDTAPWIELIRSLAAFRSDAYLDDMPALSTWLWNGESETLEDRRNTWVSALVTGDFAELRGAANLRPAFTERLAGIDETIRYRIASIMPDDVVMMEFLQEDGAPDNDAAWQSITQGSPGQRTAAMLAFVLHHGHEPLVLDQPEDDLDSEWISKLVVNELRHSRWHRQLIVVSHNANIPVLGDAEHVIALENRNGALSIRSTPSVDDADAHRESPHIGPVENEHVRSDIQSIMEGGIAAFVRREKKYNNETRRYK